MELETTQENVTENSDNSEVTEQTEPAENTDNSENESTEPENTENTQEQFGKFKSSDELLKAYSELEKKFGQQSTEIGDLRKKADLAQKLQEQIDSRKLEEANKRGFETVKDYENHKEVSKFEADSYRKHINECDYPDEMEKLLKQLEESPSKELRETIESQFPLETIKDIAGDLKLFKGQLQNREYEAQKEQIIGSAKEYLDVTVPKYLKEFENPAFEALFTEAFKAYGTEFEPDKLVNLLNQYVEYVNTHKAIDKDIEKENTDATDAIAGVVNTGGRGGKSGNLFKMSEKDAAARLTELI